MWEKIQRIWKIKDLRDSILFVLAMLIIFRIAAHIPVPGVDATSLGAVLEGNQITYQKTTCDSSRWACTQDEEVIVMTIIGEDGTETIIVIPIGAGSSGGG